MSKLNGNTIGGKAIIINAIIVGLLTITNTCTVFT